MKRKSIAGLIAIAAVAAVVMFSGCVEEEAPVSTPIPSPTPTPAVTPSSILSPTPTVQPTTPTPESKKPEILSMNSYIGNLGYFNVVGEVKNNLQSNINYVKLTATFYDAQEKVIGTDFTFTDPSDIDAGDRAPFELSSYPRKLRPSSYELQVEGN